MAAVEIALAFFALVAQGGEVVLAALVLQKAGGRWAERFLGAFLLGHACLFGIEAVIDLFQLWPAGAPGFYYSFLWGSVLVFLPSLLVGFAIGFPSLPAGIHRPGLVAATLFAPPTLLVLAATQVRYPYGSPLLDYGGTSLFLVGAFASAWIFWQKQAHAKTELERRRLRYMLKALSLPLAAGALIAVVFFVVTAGTTWERLPWYAFVPIVGALLVFVFVPPLAMGYGVLRYRLLNADLRLRFTVKHTLVASVLVTAFVIVAKVAETFIQDRLGADAVGLAAVALLVLVIQPLQGLAERIVHRMFRSDQTSEKYREFRRWETYRATFEDVSSDRSVTGKERRVLQSLAQTLGLPEDEARLIEREVLRERAGQTT